MKLADILGYQLDMARCAALRSVHRLLADMPFRPADTTALLLVRERPGCNQTMLGRMLAANRSVGMKVASRLEAHGLLTRGAGGDRRSRGLFITAEGEHVLDALLDRHRQAESRLATCLAPAERKELLRLLGKVQRAIEDEETALRHEPAPFDTTDGGQTGGPQAGGPQATETQANAPQQDAEMRATPS